MCRTHIQEAGTCVWLKREELDTNVDSDNMGMYQGVLGKAGTVNAINQGVFFLL